ncbi:type 1 fimbrial protein [Enterobacteriaceae bacterium 4M9]|nr:type 1 fimbrial protein [Enterobacteriaceae bacterium 4M9]
MGVIMELKKQSILPLYLLSTLLFSGHAFATTFLPLEGEVDARGELIEAACSIDNLHRDILVEFGDISARDVKEEGEGVLIRPFMVRLTGCTATDMGDGLLRYPYASVTFIGETTNEDPTALLTNGKGLGIRLQDRNGDILTFGQPSPGYALSSDKNILRFTASVVPVQKNVQAGEFYATARFFMDYN